MPIAAIADPSGVAVAAPAAQGPRAGRPASRRDEARRIAARRNYEGQQVAQQPSESRHHAATL